MMRAIFAKELTQFTRDGRVAAMLLVLIAFGVTAAVSGRNSVQTLERERQAATEKDEEIWNHQGEKNPHTAAHFARYAFQPVSSLSVFDPGITDYVGQAIWMEAHYRNPAQLRPIEDGIEIQRFVELSPAWILQVFAPLLIVLLAFASIAGERESSTLRHVMSTGVPPGAVLLGKGLAVFSVLALLALIVLSATFFSASSVIVMRLPDTEWRLVGMVLAHIVYLAAFTLVAIAVSAHVARSKTALVVLIGFWAVVVVFVPRVAANVGATISPAPYPAKFAEQLNKESSEPFWGGSNAATARRDAILAGLLTEYGVKTAEELPINLDGYLLQAGEEFGSDVFERLYGELWSIFDHQQEITRGFSLLSPAIAIQNITSALAGSDLFAHRHFSEEVEKFRSKFVRLLNEEMINEGGQDGYAYLSGNEFWESVPDFAYAPPRLREVLPRVWLDFLILFAWFGLATVLAARGVRSTYVEEAHR